jgi:hypothetical protein
MVRKYLKKFHNDTKTRVREIIITEENNLIKWIGIGSSGFSNSMTDLRRQIMETAKFRFGFIHPKEKLLFVLIPSLKLLEPSNFLKCRKTLIDIKKNWCGNTHLPNGKVVIRYISVTNLPQELKNGIKNYISEILHLERRKERPKGHRKSPYRS